jgi:3-oxoacyl-[acyl-carrier-protein] synthase-3
MKRSMHDAIVAALGIDPARATYLDDGDLVLLLAPGTGYTWAATALRWGPA